MASGEGGIRANTAVYFSCYTVLAANHDPRATDFLQQAWALVQTQAAKISDPKLRDAFLTKAPLHRTLATLIEAQT